VPLPATSRLVVVICPCHEQQLHSRRAWGSRHHQCRRRNGLGRRWPADYRCGWRCSASDRDSAVQRCRHRLCARYRQQLAVPAACTRRRRRRDLRVRYTCCSPHESTTSTPPRTLTVNRSRSSKRSSRRVNDGDTVFMLTAELQDRTLRPALVAKRDRRRGDDLLGPSRLSAVRNRLARKPGARLWWDDGFVLTFLTNMILLPSDIGI